jgi:predicted  nucleic acid-binding Zn-ribbon protein
MASFIYFYSKFTEEFLLLTAAGMFTLMSIYCYHWVIKKRRLGAARNQVPAGVVKAYLNQLIGEAQFVRTQLFGLIANGENPENMAAFQNLFLKGQAPSSSSYTPSPDVSTHSNSIPQDLLDRLKALENQLTEKESMVVNINVEKTKLLEEVEHLKQNEKAMNTAPASSNSDELVKKIKSLEERLEEYSLFEDDLANLKRLQQENTQLKKRLEEVGPNTPAVEPKIAAAPVVNEPKIEPTLPESEPILKDAAPFSLDQSAIDALLDGVTPTTPTPAKNTAQQVEAQSQTVSETAANASIVDQASIDALIAGSMDANPAPMAAAAELPAEPQVEPVQAPAANAGDDFEKLVDSVENSLDTVVAAPKTESLTNKTDEELLKEFENLLNS